MEVQGTNYLKRQDQPARTERPAQKLPAQRSLLRQKCSGSDRLALSRQALAFLEEQNRQAEERARQERQNQENSGMEKEQEKLLEFMGKALKTMEKCHKIATRVMAGDKVPPEDLHYLMKNDIDGYRMAIAMRKPKKDPKELDSILNSEDRAEKSRSMGQVAGIASADTADASQES